jgi:hypothetical protein
MRLRLILPLVLLLLSGCLDSDEVQATATHPLIMKGYDYAGRGISNGTGSLEIRVHSGSDQGTIVATARDAFHAYEVAWTSFGGRVAFQSGGIAEDLDMWGSSGNGSTVFPKVRVHVAAFGRVESRVDGKIEKDPSNLADEMDAILFVTQGRIRDPETLRIEDAEKLGPYDPAQPDDAYVGRIGSQAILLLFTERGELVRQYDYQDVRIKRG